MSLFNFKKKKKKRLIWESKNIKKHKHSYNTPAFVDLDVEGYHLYFRVKKCDKCNSFKCSKKKNAFGIIDTVMDGDPILYFKAKKGFESILNKAEFIEER